MLVWCWWGRVEMSKYSFDRRLANTSKKGGRFHNLAGQPMTLFSKKNKVFPDGTSRVPVCALCLLSCPRTPLSEVSCLCILLPGVGTCGWDPTLVFSSSGWTVPALLAFPHRRNASVSSFLVIIFKFFFKFSIESARHTLKLNWKIYYYPEISVKIRERRIRWRWNNVKMVLEN